jgi:hypothetical protein
MKHMILILIGAMMISTLPAVMANPVQVFTDPDVRQDDWVLNGWMEELGVGFPTDELIAAQDLGVTQYIPCPTDYAGSANILVDIRNLSGRIWTELYYVADPNTLLSNMDEYVGQVGTIGFGLAFKIDAVGLNTPLVFESMTSDGIFELGETWQFVIQDYSHPTLSAAALGSLGIAGASNGSDPLSSGSIVAIPEPASAMMILVGGFIVAGYRRIRNSGF